ncbi:MAG TPA: cob(I)yrinic acid a,c-diamide adenosyltransferase [Gammaproteobacteria bacterium]|nr:cob(I)yrinic acid a,c-diamide adenosyltransferase [Gammaproteobacteria bacterium]
MGHRLSKIYTRTGDDGSTGLGDGSRVPKDSLRIEAIGAVDELNSQLGVLRAQPLPANTDTLLAEIQHSLFDLGGELSIPGREVMTPNHVENLEQALDRLNDELTPLKEFILPGGTPAAAAAHVARSVCRRAERRLIRLQRDQPLSPQTIGYLNRLSDLLFVLARHLNHSQQNGDVLWQPGRPQAGGRMDDNH